DFEKQSITKLDMTQFGTKLKSSSFSELSSVGKMSDTENGQTEEKPQVDVQHKQHDDTLSKHGNYLGLGVVDDKLYYRKEVPKHWELQIEILFWRVLQKHKANEENLFWKSSALIMISLVINVHSSLQAVQTTLDEVNLTRLKKKKEKNNDNRSQRRYICVSYKDEKVMGPVNKDSDRLVGGMQHGEDQGNNPTELRTLIRLCGDVMEEEK
ncbi:hypothetical protein RFI_02326, partial [Reticulomyxa filosa]